MFFLPTLRQPPYLGLIKLLLLYFIKINYIAKFAQLYFAREQSCMAIMLAALAVLLAAPLKELPPFHINKV